MTKYGIPFITGTLKERVVVSLCSLPLAGVSFWAVLTGESVIRDLDSGSTTARAFGFAVFRFLCIELFASAGVFLLLAFVWATFQPRWVSRYLLRISRHVWRFICLLLLSLLILALVIGLVDIVA